MKKYVRRGREVFLIAMSVCLLVAVMACAVLVDVLWPEAPGDVTYSSNKLVVDASNASYGYVMAHGADGSKPLKLRVVKDGTTLTYNLNNNGEYETFPLQLGQGKYTFQLYENVKGNGYAEAGSLSFSVEIDDENTAFLFPNEYVNYNIESPAVLLSEEICEGLETDQEKLDAVCQYVRENFTYDWNKAKNIKAGVLPSADYLIEHRMGICQDISAFIATTLRVQGIPTQLVIGYVNKNYHAWNSVLIDGEYVFVDMTAEIANFPDGMRYTVERFY